MFRQKRVIAINDISCAGKCSLTVALPIISAAGIEVSALPTALLSAHTGFEGYTYKDLTEDLMPAAKHWKSLDLTADALYTGFLGSMGQIEIVSAILDMFRTKDNFTLIDPVMADDGKLYKVYDSKYPQKMKELVRKADILVPNITEAALLTDSEYKKGPYTRSYVENLIKKLSDTGAKYIILTGVWFKERYLGAAALDALSGNIEYFMADKIAGSYPGTGDIFASAFLAARLNGKDVYKSTQIAVDFTVGCIRRTYLAGTDPRFGVNFEEGLENFIKEIR
jgi:pyridoxine kinase